MTPNNKAERMRLSDEKVRELAVLADKAFRAPWTYTAFTVECTHHERPICGEKDEDDCQTEGEVIRIESPDEYPDGQVIADVPGLEMFAEANGKFIAEARNNVPALCADLLDARAEVERLKSKLRDAAAGFPDEIGRLFVRAEAEVERWKRATGMESAGAAASFLNGLTIPRSRAASERLIAKAEARAESAEKERDHWKHTAETERDYLGRQQKARQAAEKERDALAAFKAYVHQRLDEAGIPTHPNGPHSAAGCRVGDRLDLFEKERDEARAKVRELAAVMEKARPIVSGYARASERHLEWFDAALSAVKGGGK